MPISHSENLVRNQVQAAYQQNLFLQGVNCVFYKVWSVYFIRCGVCIAQVVRVYCTRCADCIVQVMHCVLYRVFVVDFKGKSSVNMDFDINLI